jgi:predicted transcriptional regulator
MAKGETAAVALISIHPQYAEAILDGTKQVEFRKVAFKRQITHALLYATCPIQLIVGFVEVVGIDERSPDALWRRYRRVAGIERAAFFNYYKGKSVGFAVRISRPQRLLRPVGLHALLRDATPPQSFLYSSADSIDRVQRLARAA